MELDVVNEGREKAYQTAIIAALIIALLPFAVLVAWVPSVSHYLGFLNNNLQNDLFLCEVGFIFGSQPYWERWKHCLLFYRNIKLQLSFGLIFQFSFNFRHCFRKGLACCGYKVMCYQERQEKLRKIWYVFLKKRRVSFCWVHYDLKLSTPGSNLSAPQKPVHFDGISWFYGGWSTIFFGQMFSIMYSKDILLFFKEIVYNFYDYTSVNLNNNATSGPDDSIRGVQVTPCSFGVILISWFKFWRKFQWMLFLYSKP